MPQAHNLMDVATLADLIAQISELPSTDLTAEHLEVFDELKRRLNAGEVRAAERRDGVWHVNTWVKRGILLGFRLGRIRPFGLTSDAQFFDKHTYPLKHLSIEDAVRVVPGGSSIRDGCYIGRGVTCMPPMFVNVGAYVDDGTMIDSHALVGSCAQIGKRVHLSAGAQIGGVLEPVGEVPVVVEDEVLVGGNCGVYEGAIVRERAVLAAGTIITGGTPVYDVVRNQVYRKTPDAPLEIPAGAVVVPGARRIARGPGADLDLSIATPIIVKYRDQKTDTQIRLEDYLR